MKGKISPKLARVLRNEDASNRLRQLIRKGEDGDIQVNGKTYHVTTKLPVTREPQNVTTLESATEE